jgi:hypothetical protein
MRDVPHITLLHCLLRTNMSSPIYTDVLHTIRSHEIGVVDETAPTQSRHNHHDNRVSCGAPGTVVAPASTVLTNKKVPDIVAIEEEGWVEVVTQNRRGRQIKLLTRFK